MLQTLNKAWISILANQINKRIINSALFVTMGEDEYVETERLLGKLCGMRGCWVFDVNNVKEGVSGLLCDMVFDDVLVSHEMTNPSLRNYLAKHCGRIHKESKGGVYVPRV